MATVRLERAVHEEQADTRICGDRERGYRVRFLDGLFPYPLRWLSRDKKIGLLFDGAFQSLKKFIEGGGKVAASEER
jgi:hypothetical protein